MADDQLFKLRRSHRREVIDIQIALGTISDAIVPRHLLPIGGTGRRNSQVAEHIVQRLVSRHGVVNTRSESRPVVWRLFL